MSRKHTNLSARRQILADAQYNSKTVAKFTNYLMKSGNKETAEKIIYSVLTELEHKLRKPAGALLEEILESVAPKAEMRNRKIGGSQHASVHYLTSERSRMLGMRWILDAARNRKERGIANKLREELLDITLEKGNTIKKREELNRLVDKNVVKSRIITRTADAL